MSITNGMSYRPPKNILPIYNPAEYKSQIAVAAASAVTAVETDILDQNNTLTTNQAIYESRVFSQTSGTFTQKTGLNPSLYTYTQLVNLTTSANSTYLFTFTLNFTSVNLTTSSTYVDIVYLGRHLYYYPIVGQTQFGFTKTVAFQPSSSSTSFNVYVYDTLGGFGNYTLNATSTTNTPVYSLISL